MKQRRYLLATLIAAALAAPSAFAAIQSQSISEAEDAPELAGADTEGTMTDKGAAKAEDAEKARKAADAAAEPEEEEEEEEEEEGNQVP